MITFLALLIPIIRANYEGISFVVLGDFASMKNLSIANKVFDTIDSFKKEALPGSPEDFQFFVTVGDNLYPANETHPTDDEFELLMNLFQTRWNIQDLPILPVRGNHDCYFTDM